MYLPDSTYTKTQGANAIDLLGAEVLVLSRAALETLTARLMP